MGKLHYQKLEPIKLCIYSDGRIVSVCVCVCRFAQFLMAEAAHSEIRVFVGRFAQFLIAEAGGRGRDPTTAKQC